ncbi:MAG: efflux RND transporter periplasmic adaptor subunit [Undibacterium sp.]|nr:efflux RND transporter periplasmic adaptor subunit [Undibacterium sp.]
MSTIKLQTVIKLAIISHFICLLSACNKPSSATPVAMPAMPPPEVTVVTVQAKELPIDFEYVGQTAGMHETEVRARISGIIEKRLYEEGARVKAGQVLFQIDQGSYQTQLAAMEAQAAVSIARLNQAKRDLARILPLAKEKMLPQKSLDDAQSALEMAEASDKQVRAQVNEAKLNLSYTRVTAPISGVTGVATKANGSLVSASDSLLTSIIQTDPLRVNFSVSEADFLKLKTDLTSGKLTIAGATTPHVSNGSLNFEVKLKLADGSIYPTTGKMDFASEKVNSTSGGFDARAQFANPDNVLRPGQFVRVILQGARRSAAIAIPQRAVIDSPMGKIVFVVSKEDKLVPHPVELDGWSRGEWVVTKGLQSGDRVLVDGFIKAHDPGMLVKPMALASK